MPRGNAEERIARMEAWAEISNLQGRYNHYLQTGQMREKLGELFAFNTPGVAAEMADSGLWEGREGVIRLFTHLGGKYAMNGALMLHMLNTPVIEIMPDLDHAHGMWNSFGTNSYLDENGTLTAMWQAGKYDNQFVREDGRWKFLRFRWYVIFRTPYEQGWVKQPIVEGLHAAGFPPVNALYRPYDPSAAQNYFPPFPPEPSP